MFIKAIGIVILCSVTIVSANITINLSGLISNSKGATLSNAIVTLEKASLVTESNAAGKYLFNATIGVKQPVSSIQTPSFNIKNGYLSINHSFIGSWNLKAYNLNGKMIWSRTGNSINDNSQIQLLSVPSVTLYVLSMEHQEYVIKANAFNSTYTLVSNSILLLKTNASASVLNGPLDTIRVSKAGYISKRIPVTSFSGTLNVTLDTLVSDSTGNSPFTDGSIDRLAKYGVAQYFWGPIGGIDQPIVKIVHAVSADVVDIEVIFSPYFVDNTYGVNSIGWGKRGHTFRDLYVSDHVALTVSNGSGATVFEGKLDLISPSTNAPSGYACLGPYGGDGALTIGNSSDIISYGNSLDDNLNYYGYDLKIDSPVTDSTYKADPQYPKWQFYVIYRLSIKASAFGSSGYGKVMMSSVHASPGKQGEETITVTEKGPPTPNTPTDVFRYILPPVIKPPVIDTIDVD